MPATPAFEQATNIAAGAAIASPFALPWIEEVSDVAALWLPILGAIWLLVQIITRLKDWRK